MTVEVDINSTPITTNWSACDLIDKVTNNQLNGWRNLTVPTSEKVVIVLNLPFGMYLDSYALDFTAAPGQKVNWTLEMSDYSRNLAQSVSLSDAAGSGVGLIKYQLPSYAPTFMPPSYINLEIQGAMRVGEFVVYGKPASAIWPKSVGSMINRGYSSSMSRANWTATVDGITFVGSTERFPLGYEYTKTYKAVERVCGLIHLKIQPLLLTTKYLDAISLLA